MTERRRDAPPTKSSAPTTPPSRTTEDEAVPRTEHDAPASKRASDEREVRGDRMPAGADEPGAGL